MLTDKRPICRRCLLSDIDPEGLYKKVIELVASLPENIKCPDDEYRRRLSICRSCDDLQNGVCRECGCFVELRAAAGKNYCPNAKKFWLGLSGF